MFKVSMIFCLAALQLSCQSTKNGFSETKLIGGQAATASDFPATFDILRSCTATKVGEHMLITAAHCVVDPVVQYYKDQYVPGATLTIESSRDPASDVTLASEFSVHIKNIFIHPGYLAACQPPMTECTGEVGRPPYPPDVAVIEVSENTPTIPVATISYSSVAVGTPVAILGYGCQHGLNTVHEQPQLRFDLTKTAGPEALNHPGANVASAADLAKSFVITPGVSGGGASICPGDSGGPLYRMDGQSPQVVGINAYYSFLPSTQDAARVAVTNWHTRLDDGSSANVGGWLRGILGGTATPTLFSAPPIRVDRQSGNSATYAIDPSGTIDIPLLVVSPYVRLTLVLMGPADNLSITDSNGHIVVASDGTAALGRTEKTTVLGNGNDKSVFFEFPITLGIYGVKVSGPVGTMFKLSSMPQSIYRHISSVRLDAPPISDNLFFPGELDLFTLSIPAAGPVKVAVNGPSNMVVNVIPIAHAQGPNNVDLEFPGARSSVSKNLAAGDYMVVVAYIGLIDPVDWSYTLEAKSGN